MNVTTVGGKLVPREKTRKIRDQYYEIDVDAVKIGDVWYKTSGDKVVYNHTKKKYVLKSEASHLIKGLVGPKDLGYFEKDPFNNINTVHGHVGMSAQCLGDAWIEDFSTGLFHKKEDLSSTDLIKMKKIRSTSGAYQNFGYNAEDNVDDFRTKKRYVAQFDDFGNVENLKKYSKFLGDATFGAEIEFSSGYYTEIIRNRCGIVLCRDGSTTSGGEAVTVPLSGAKGVAILREIGDFSSSRIAADRSCSYHIHWGNCLRNNKELIALYRLCEIIQAEMFTMFPHYKTAWKNIKRQNYNQLLLSKFGKTEKVTDSFVDKSMGNLFHWLSGERLDGSHYKKRPEHPARNKWERKARYYWINFMNMFFGDRSTVEFRLHHNTTNPYKLVNWLYITRAIIYYAQVHADDILKMDADDKISLRSVINIYRDMNALNSDAAFLSEYLNAYIKERKAFFLKLFKNRDIHADEETNLDSVYSFIYKGKSLL